MSKSLHIGMVSCASMSFCDPLILGFFTISSHFSRRCAAVITGTGSRTTAPVRFVRSSSSVPLDRSTSLPLPPPSLSSHPSDSDDDDDPMTSIFFAALFWDVEGALGCDGESIKAQAKGLRHCKGE